MTTRKILSLKKIICTIGIFLFLSISSGCSSSYRFTKPVELPDDTQNIPQPRPQEINILADGFEKQIMMQIEQFVDISRHLRKLFNNKKESINVDAFDEAVNSTWFTNRNAQKRLSVAEIARGPDTGSGPDIVQEWTIFQAKLQGKTPGFSIIDGRGNRFVIKFDPLEYPELVSGAEIVSTKLFHAAGYYVAGNYLAVFHPRILRLGENVRFTEEKGRARNMTEDDLRKILQKVAVLPDGSIRVIASKFIEGILLGPFKYQSRRKDDPNDIILHQHRRELRGLRVMAAWLNHYDTKANNTFDAHVSDGDRKYVKHYLIDFGSTLGSISSGPKPQFIGHENTLDPEEMFKKTVTLGFHVREYEKSSTIRYPTIGNFSSELFHPQRYKFIFPNPAFDNLTDRDGYWGAKLVMSFTDVQLETAVKTARYSDPDAARYLVSVLKERRDIVGKYWFDRVNPLDNFILETQSDGLQQLRFDDLAVVYGFENSNSTSYRFSVVRDGRKVQDFITIKGEPQIPLPDPLDIVESIYTGDSDSAGPEWVISIETKRGEHTQWMNPVRVFLLNNRDSGTYTLAGIKR